MAGIGLSVNQSAVQEPRFPLWLTNFAINLLLYGMLIVISMFMILPFIWMLSTSFKPQSEIFTRPPIFISSNMSMDGYRFIIEKGALRALWNTALISTLATILSLFFCTLGGYGFSKYRFPGRNLLFMLLLGTMMIPGAVTMVPSYLIMRDL